MIESKPATKVTAAAARKIPTAAEILVGPLVAIARSELLRQTKGAAQLVP